MLFLYRNLEQLEKRLDELRPQVKEARELEAAIRAIKGSIDAPSSGARMSLDERKRQIVDLLRSQPNLRVRDLAAETGVTDARITQILKVMERESVVQRNGGRIEVL